MCRRFMSRAFPLLLTLSWSAVVFAQEIIWSPETLFTTLPYSNSATGAPQQSKVVVTSDGQVHIVWTSYNPNPVTSWVYYKRYIPGTGWTEDTCISADLAQRHQCWMPAIAADSQDNIHTVWQEYSGYHIWYKMRRSDGTWDTVSTEISVGGDSVRRGSPKVSCTPDGNVHTMWLEWRSGYGAWLVYREKRGDVWMPPVTVDSVDSTCSISSYFGFAASRDGRLHLAFTVQRSPFSWYYYRCRAGGLWGTREEILPRVFPFYRNGVVMTINPFTCHPHFCWAQQGYINHIYIQNGVWCEETLVPPDPVNRQGEWALGFDRDGVGYFVWHVVSRLDTCYLFYRRRGPLGEWGPPQIVRSDYPAHGAHPFITAGGNSENYNHLYLLRTLNDYSILRVGFMHGVPAGQGVVSEEMPGSGGDRPLRLLSSGCGEYFLERGCRVHLALYDPAGRLVRELDRGRKPRGRHTFRIPESLAAGVYFVHLQAEGVEAARKMVRIR